MATLRVQAGDPTLDASDGAVYTKDVAGTTELFYKDSAGSVSQVTTGGGVGNANTLDSLDSTQFLRSDVADTAAGLITHTAIPAFNGGSSGATAPFTVDSTFLVTNLNADLLDGQEGSSYARSNTADTISGVHTHSARPVFNGGTSGADSPFTVDSTFVVANLNADLVDGQEGSFYQNSDNQNAGTIPSARLPAATNSVVGALETATNSESNTGTTGGKILTPSNFNQRSIGTNGHYKLPGGLIIQWGRQVISGTTTTITFPLTFPNACFIASATTRNEGDIAGVSFAPALKTTPTTTTLTLSTDSGQDDIHWFAIGN